MIWRKGKFCTAAVPKNSQHWSWGDIRLFQRWLPATVNARSPTWTSVYVGPLAARMTTTEDGAGWSRLHAGCSRKDTMAPDHAVIGKRAQPAWNRCVLETATSEGLAASVWCAHTKKINTFIISINSVNTGCQKHHTYMLHPKKEHMQKQQFCGTLSLFCYVNLHKYSSYTLQKSHYNKNVCDRGQNSASVIVWRLMLYTRLASPVAVYIAIRGRYTRLAWLANPNLSNPSYG